MKGEVASVGTAVLARFSAHYKRDSLFPLIAQTWKDFWQTLFSENLQRLVSRSSLRICNDVKLTGPRLFRILVTVRCKSKIDAVPRNREIGLMFRSLYSWYTMHRKLSGTAQGPDIDSWRDIRLLPWSEPWPFSLEPFTNILWGRSNIHGNVSELAVLLTLGYC